MGERGVGRGDGRRGWSCGVPRWWPCICSGWYWLGGVVGVEVVDRSIVEQVVVEGGGGSRDQ